MFCYGPWAPGHAATTCLVALTMHVVLHCCALSTLCPGLALLLYSTNQETVKWQAVGLSEVQSGIITYYSRYWIVCKGRDAVHLDTAIR